MDRAVAEERALFTRFCWPNAVDDPRSVVSGHIARVRGVLFFPLRAVGDGPTLREHDVVPVLEGCRLRFVFDQLRSAVRKKFNFWFSFYRIDSRTVFTSNRHH